MNVSLNAFSMACLAVTVSACNLGGSSGSGDSLIGPNILPTPNPVDVEPPPEPPLDLDGLPGGSLAARQFFVQNVYPTLRDLANPERCSSCHFIGVLGAPSFLANSPFSAYNIIREYNAGALAAVPEKNLLLLKGQHEGPQLNGTQRGVILQWLRLEYPNRPTPPVTESMFDALDNFATCMSRQEFKAQQLDQLYSTELTNIPGVTCVLCHGVTQATVNGASVVLDPDGDITFDNFRLVPGVMKLATPTVNKYGTFDGLRQSERLVTKGAEFNLQGSTVCSSEADSVALVQAGGVINVDDPLYCHPNYILPAVVEDKLDQFVTSTLNRAKAQVCTSDNNP